MSEDTPPTYEVGYKKPPKHTRFPKGQSGNPRGRPKRSDALDVSALLEEPISVRVDGRTREMQQFEVILRRLANRAMDGHLPSIKRFIGLCEHYGVLVPSKIDVGGGVVVAPKGVDFYAWMDSVTELVPADELDDE